MNKEFSNSVASLVIGGIIVAWVSWISNAVNDLEVKMAAVEQRLPKLAEKEPVKKTILARPGLPLGN